MCSAAFASAVSCGQMRLSNAENLTAMHAYACLQAAAKQLDSILQPVVLKYVGTDVRSLCQKWRHGQQGSQVKQFRAL